MIKINNLKKSFKEGLVLKGINLEIKKGDMYGIIGKSGSGKSTLLRCINGLSDYDSGEVLVNGKDVGSLNEKELKIYRKNIGMIFQHFSLLERLTVYENIALPLKCWNYNKNDIDNKVRELSSIVGLNDKLHSRPKELSGGQKQRVAIARALTMNPEILLCDEATSALDPKTSESIISLLKDINKKMNITVIIVTHQMEVLKKACNKVAIIEKGCIAHSGNIQDTFLERPESLVNLIGDESKYLPKVGVNLEFTILEENGHSILSDLSKQGVSIELVSLNTKEWSDKLFREITLNVNEKDFSKVKKYFEKNNLKYRLLGG